MEFLKRSIHKTADIAGGYRVGTLIIEPQGQGTFLQVRTGRVIPTTGYQVEVKNGNQWQVLTPDDYNRKTADGYPAYAGLDARMMKAGGDKYASSRKWAISGPGD